MHLSRLPAFLALSVALFLARSAFAAEPMLPRIGGAMQEMVAKNEIADASPWSSRRTRFFHASF